MYSDNPFSDNKVTDAWKPAVSDVPAIHAAAFDLCCTALHEVQHSTSSRSVLLFGEAGIGKTHLLARLRTHLGIEHSSAVSHATPTTQVLFTAVRLQAGARMVCRHVRRTLADDLLGGWRKSYTQLDRLLMHRLLPRLNHKDSATALAWWRSLRQPANANRAEKQIEGLLDEFDHEAELDRNLRTALCHWCLGRQCREVREWLRGNTLPESTMQQLGLVGTSEDEDPEMEALDLICGFSRLCGPDIPLVLCFDQIEALQIHPQDKAGLFAFGQMIASLRDQTRNTILITCVQSACRDLVKSAIRDADWDRLCEQHGLLERLSCEQAELLVAARLKSFPAINEQRPAAADCLWPLKRDTLQRFVESQGTGRCTPRELISFCNDEFQKWQQGSVTPAVSTAEFLSIKYQSELQRALSSTDPQRSDDILAHALPLAMEVTKHGRLSDSQPSPDIDLVIESPSGCKKIAFCNQSGNKLTGRLKRLREQVEFNDVTNLVLLRDSRLPLPESAKKAHEHLRAIKQRRIPFVQPSVDAIAALDAIRCLISDAKAGDLANHGQAVAPDSVQKWLSDNLSDSVHQLLGQILPGAMSSGRDTLLDELHALVQRHHIICVAEAAEKLGRGVDEVDRCLRWKPETFAVLQGPPRVVVELVPDAAVV